MIRRTKRTDLEVRQDLVIREQDKMIRALTEELMRARQDERERIREYILSRMGHCEDCDLTAWQVDGPFGGDEPPCDCAYRTVERMFDECGGEEE